MTYDSRQLKQVCSELGINPNQMFILHSLYQNDRSLEELVYEYKQKMGKAPFTSQEVEELVKKGYLINNNGVDDIILDDEGVTMADYSINLELTEEFTEMFFIATNIAGEELFAAYPGFVEINGAMIPLKKGGEFNGKYFSREGLIKLYGKKIQNNIVLHQRILKSVERAATMKKLSVGIRHFIIDELWRDYFDLEDNSQANITAL